MPCTGAMVDAPRFAQEDESRLGVVVESSSLGVPLAIPVEWVGALDCVHTAMTAVAFGWS